MTREQQRQRREAKKALKIALKLERRQEARELKGWLKMVEKAKAKGAWIEDETNLITQ